MSSSPAAPRQARRNSTSVRSDILGAVTATAPQQARRPNPDDAPRAALYCRISSDPRDTGLGVDRQREECAALATARGWRVVPPHRDNDVAASSGRRRPGSLALLGAIEAGRVDV